RRMVRPMTFWSASNCWRQKPLERTMTWSCPGVSSDEAKKRPSAGLTSSVLKRFALTVLPKARADDPIPVTLNSELRVYAETLDRLVARRWYSRTHALG